MTSPSKNAFKCPRWLQCTCCISPILFLGFLSLGAAFGIAVSPYVVIPVVLLNAKVIAAAFGSDLAPLITFGNAPLNKLLGQIKYHDAIEKKDEAA